MPRHYTPQKSRARGEAKLRKELSARRLLLLLCRFSFQTWNMLEKTTRGLSFVECSWLLMHQSEANYYSKAFLILLILHGKKAFPLTHYTWNHFCLPFFPIPSTQRWSLWTLSSSTSIVPSARLLQSMRPWNFKAFIVQCQLWWFVFFLSIERTNTLNLEHKSDTLTWTSSVRAQIAIAHTPARLAARWNAMGWVGTARQCPWKWRQWVECWAGTARQCL